MTEYNYPIKPDRTTTDTYAKTDLWRKYLDTLQRYDSYGGTVPFLSHYSTNPEYYLPTKQYPRRVREEDLSYNESGLYNGDLDWDILKELDIPISIDPSKDEDLTKHIGKLYVSPLDAGTRIGDSNNPLLQPRPLYPSESRVNWLPSYFFGGKQQRLQDARNLEWQYELMKEISRMESEMRYWDQLKDDEDVRQEQKYNIAHGGSTSPYSVSSGLDETNPEGSYISWKDGERELIPQRFDRASFERYLRNQTRWPTPKTGREGRSLDYIEMREAYPNYDEPYSYVPSSVSQQYINKLRELAMTNPHINFDKTNITISNPSSPQAALAYYDSFQGMTNYLTDRITDPSSVTSHEETHRALDQAGLLSTLGPNRAYNTDPEARRNMTNAEYGTTADEMYDRYARYTNPRTLGDTFMQNQYQNTPYANRFQPFEYYGGTYKPSLDTDNRQLTRFGAETLFPGLSEEERKEYDLGEGSYLGVPSYFEQHSNVNAPAASSTDPLLKGKSVYGDLSKLKEAITGEKRRPVKRWGVPGNMISRYSSYLKDKNPAYAPLYGGSSIIPNTTPNMNPTPVDALEAMGPSAYNHMMRGEDDAFIRASDELKNPSLKQYRSSLENNARSRMQAEDSRFKSNNALGNPYYKRVVNQAQVTPDMDYSKETGNIQNLMPINQLEGLNKLLDDADKQWNYENLGGDLTGYGV